MFILSPEPPLVFSLRDPHQTSSRKFSSLPSLPYFSPQPQQCFLGSSSKQPVISPLSQGLRLRRNPEFKIQYSIPTKASWSSQAIYGHLSVLECIYNHFVSVLWHFYRFPILLAHLLNENLNSFEYQTKSLSSGVRHISNPRPFTIFSLGLFHQ